MPYVYVEVGGQLVGLALSFCRVVLEANSGCQAWSLGLYLLSHPTGLGKMVFK